MGILHSRYFHRAAIAFNYKTNGGRGRFKNAKRHAGSMVRYAKRINKRYVNR